MRVTENVKKQIRVWVKALRSGKYEQTESRLNDDGGYCCLGVACELFIPQRKLVMDEYGFIKGEMPNDQMHAPRWLQDVDRDFSVRTGAGEFDNGPKLSELNDDGIPFESIAQQIEDCYLKPKKKKKASK